MTDDPREPPREIWLDLESALELLAVLEELREELADLGKLTLVLSVEEQILRFHRKLDFDEGGGDG